MYNKCILDNGIRVVMEKIPYVDSVSIGVWIENGSKEEDKHLNGVSHFIEHMLFKGTEKRTSKQIAESIDNVGGQLNAFTSKEFTCFYAKVLNTHIQIAIDILSDMLTNPLFSEEDIQKEKKVIIEEINMYEDSPEDIAYDLLAEIMFENNTLSLPILGTLDSLNNINRKTIYDYYKTHYIPQNIVISLAGNFNMKETKKLLNNYFGNFNMNFEPNQVIEYNTPVFCQKIKGKLKDIEQLNFCLGMEGIPSGDDDIFSLFVLNNIFGGSMSSRLFQRIREEKGLVYSVYSHPSFYKEVGAFTIYAGLNLNQIYQVSKIIKSNIKNIKENLITKDELRKSKEQLKGNYILGLESTSSRMVRIGKSELIYNKIRSPKEILKKIDDVSIDNIRYMVNKIFDYNKFNIAYVGNISDEIKFEENIKNIFFVK